MTNVNIKTDVRRQVKTQNDLELAKEQRNYKDMKNALSNIDIMIIY